MWRERGGYRAAPCEFYGTGDVLVCLALALIDVFVKMVPPTPLRPAPPRLVGGDDRS